MFRVLWIVAFALAFLVAGDVSAQSCPPNSANLILPPTDIQAMPPAPAVKFSPVAPQTELTSTPEELNFLANGPRLYPMDKALELSKATGKPVVCWMGKHLFSDERARKLSTELKETTIQAAMDKDDTPYDQVGPRVKFTDGNYTDDAKTYYIRLANFDRPGQGERMLAVARGGR